MIRLKRAEKALRESEERYRLLFETSRDAIMTLAPPSWNFTSGNAAAIELFGMKDKKTFISAPPWKYSPEFQPDGQSSADKAKKMIDTAMEKGSNFFEWTHKKLNGRDFFATVLLTRISIGEKTFLQATVRDITERKKVEEELKKHREHLEDMVENRTAELKKEIVERRQVEKLLRESKEKIRAILDASPDVIHLLDINGIILSANESYAKKLGVEVNDIVGKNIFDYTPPESIQKRKAVIDKVFSTGEPVQLEDKGVVGVYDAHVHPVLNPAGEVAAVAVYASDITKRKQAEKELQEQKLNLEQKNIALSEIIAQVEVEKKKMKDDIAANVNELLFPILEKLKLENAAGKYVDLLKTHLEELVSSFGRKIRGKRLNLTPREIEICNMIKGRLTSKEIAELLNISLQTIEKHRKNIRRKMGISKKDINLTSFLQVI